MVKLYLQHCSRTVQRKYLSVCSAFYGGLFPEPRVACNVNIMNGCEHYKVGQFQRRKDSLVTSDSQPVSTFQYLKNLLLTIQTRVLSSVE